VERQGIVSQKDGPLTAILRCWLDLRRIRETSDVCEPVDFAFAHCISPFQDRSELVEFMRIVASFKPRTCLEIGTAAGGTLFVLCRVSDPRATVISIDLPRGRFGAGYHPIKIPLYRSFAARGQSLHLLREDSHQPVTLCRVKRILRGRPLDYLFLDGDHTYEGVRQDFEVYSPLVRKRGIVAFHDIARFCGDSALAGSKRCGGEVPRFWDEVKTAHKCQEIVSRPEVGGYGIGILWL